MWPFRGKKQARVEKKPPPYHFERPTKEETEGINIIERDEVITQRQRTPANACKLEILQAMLNVLADEDMDAMFVAILTEAASLGYKLRDEPEALLERLKRQFHG